MLMSSKYVRLTKSIFDKGILVDQNAYLDHVDSEKDYYLSTYLYNDSHLEQFKKTGSVKGIRDVQTDQIWFDFDSKESPERALTDTVQVVERLKTSGIKEKNIQIYFSGRKGTTVVVKLNRFLTPDQVKSIVINKFGKGLETLDYSMYDTTQLLRVPGTKHQISGLYKIPLTYDELKNLSLDEIKQKASSLDNLDHTKFIWEAETITDDMIPAEEKKSVKAPVVTDKPRHWKDYKWHLLQGNFEVGERHSAMMVIASTCRALGYDADTTTMMCLAADAKYCERTKESPIEDLESNIIPSVFSETWKGGQYSPQTDPWLAKYCEKHGFETQKTEAMQIYDIKDSFKEYVVNIEKNTIKTGIPVLDKALPLTIGMNLGVVGAASSGKTALALNILKNTSKSGVVSVFASLDMHRNRLFEKLLYKETGLPREALYEKIKNNELDDAFAKIKEDYGNVYFYDRSSPTVRDIRSYIEHIESTTGNKVKLVMLDYFERVNSDKSEDTAASKDISGQLQDLVNDLNVCMVTLVQPNKFSLSGGPDSPLTNYTSIKGSSFLYQSFRSILSIWRPFFNPEWKDHDRFLQMAILKNDLGELDIFDFSWKGKTGEIRELAQEEKEEFEELLKRKKEQKEAQKDSAWQ